LDRESNPRAIGGAKFALPIANNHKKEFEG